MKPKSERTLNPSSSELGFFTSLSIESDALIRRHVDANAEMPCNQQVAGPG